MTTKPLIIGIAGRARSGKDTTAEHLREHHGFEIVRFADPIKRMIEALGVSSTYSEGLKEIEIPRIGVSYRKLAQTLGTEWGRHMIGPNLWLNIAEYTIEQSRSDRFVIPDVRFPNEAAWIRSVGHLWHITRPDAPDVRPHISELGIGPLEGEVFLANDGSLDELYSQVRGALRMSVREEA